MTNKALIHGWGGGAIDWIECELLFHIAYMFTFIILMGKSRFMTVGTDNTQQFQPTYMSFLADHIVRNVPFFGRNAERMKPKHLVKR